MRILRSTISVVSTIAGFSLSSLAQAGTVTAFDFSPLARASAIPVLNDVLLVMLGLLLCVVAVRTLRANRGQQKFFSILLLGGGLLVGGLGAERSVAIGIQNFTFGSGDGDYACEEQTAIEYYNGAKVTNNCKTPVKVTPYLVDEQCFELNNDGNCDVVDSGQECTLPTSSSVCVG